MAKLHKITFILLVVGGLNWLLTAFGYGIGNYLPAQVSMIVYVLVGLSAINEVVIHKATCRECNKAGGSMAM